MHFQNEPVTLWSEVENLGRRRLQQQGELENTGGWWLLRWREDVLKPDGSRGRGRSPRVRLGPSEGPGKITEKEARRIAWDDHLSKLDQNVTTPQSVMTVAQFVEMHFYPNHILRKKKNTQTFYRSRLKDVLKPNTVMRIFGRPENAEFAKKTKARVEVPGWPYLDDVRLRDLTQDHVEWLVTSMIERDVAPATVKHAKTTCSAIITYAKKKGFFKGDNPAQGTETPELVPVKELWALTLEQLELVLTRLKYPARQMCQLAVLTSMNVAEINGLQWKRVNLTDKIVIADGAPLPPRSLSIRRQLNQGRMETTKRKSRNRVVPLSQEVVAMLVELKQREKYTGPEDYVFVSKRGTPVDTHNLANRALKKVGAELDMPWLSWHVFRRTHTTLLAEDGLEIADRQKLMGHANETQTRHYERHQVERQREHLGRLSKKVFKEFEADGPIN